MRSRKLGLILFVGFGAWIVPQCAAAQTASPAPAAKPKAVAAKHPTAAATKTTAAPTDVNKTLKNAADALGMLRGINRVDAINRMEYWASGTSSITGQPAVVEYHATLSYNPPGLRVDISHPSVTGAKQQHMIQVVNDKYAWNETEPGAGLEGSKGTATPDSESYDERYLQLWTFPYGVVKSALAAGDDAKLSTEDGATVVTFPMSGRLSGITVKATLNAKKLVTKVVTSGKVATEFDYSEYGDHGDDPSDVQFPGHIIEKRDGKVVMDLRVKMDDPNNPYAIFPTPPSVAQATN